MQFAEEMIAAQKQLIKLGHQVELPDDSETGTGIADRW